MTAVFGSLPGPPEAAYARSASVPDRAGTRQWAFQWLAGRWSAGTALPDDPPVVAPPIRSFNALPVNAVQGPGAKLVFYECNDCGEFQCLAGQCSPGTCPSVPRTFTPQPWVSMPCRSMQCRDTSAMGSTTSPRTGFNALPVKAVPGLRAQYNVEAAALVLSSSADDRNRCRKDVRNCRKRHPKRP